MSPENAFVDVSSFPAVDQVSDTATMIAMLDRLNRFLVGPKETLLNRLSVDHARAVLDVGCGTGGDVVDMASRMPRGGAAVGMDASEAMITEARRRHGEASTGDRGGADIAFRLGDALDLPYADHTFDVCRVETVLQHLRDAGRAVQEMVRVTRPGGRVGALEFDEGGWLLDHPDQPATRAILDAYADSMACGWMGRQLPRMFREAGLTEVSVDAVVILGTFEAARALLTPAVTRLRDKHVLSPQQVNDWWAALDQQAAVGNFLGGSVAFVVTGTRPR